MANFSGTCLLPVGNLTLKTTDQEINDRLEVMGYTVTTKLHSDAFLDTDANWETFDVAVVSESVSSSTMGTSGRDAVVGVVQMEGGSVDDWDLATSETNGADTDDGHFIISHVVNGGVAGSGGGTATNEHDFATEAKDMRGMTDESSGAIEVVTSDANGQGLLTTWLLGADLTTGTAADRRVWNGMFREDGALPGGGDESGGFVNNDSAWNVLEASVFWAQGVDVSSESTLQLGVPVADLVTTGWTKVDATNYFADVDDGETPDNATTMVTSPNNPIASPISFDLTSLSDPTNNQLHTVAVGWRRETGSRTLTLDVQLRMGYVNESTLGTEIATSGADGADGGTDWGGTHLQLTSSEIDLITDYTDLQIRCLANTSGGGATTRVQITSIRLLTDGPGVVAATVYPPFPRRQNTLVRM